jgi:hypothetical protein
MNYSGVGKQVNQTELLSNVYTVLIKIVSSNKESENKRKKL